MMSSKEDEEDSLLASPSFIKEHLREKARQKFDRISGVVTAAGDGVVKASTGVLAKAEAARDMAVSATIGGKSKSGTKEEEPSQQELHDPDEPSDDNNSNSNNFELSSHLRHFGKMCLVGLAVYFLGYLQWTFLLVLIPLALQAARDRQKLARKQKAIFHKNVALMGEEKALRLVLKELPTWATFPDVERAEWLNSMLSALWPHLSLAADKVLRAQVEPIARVTLESYRLWGFKFKQIDLGTIAPRLTGIKVHEDRKRNEIVLDLDFDYRGDADVGISLMKVEASVCDVQVSGRLRVVLSPLTNELPLVGGVQLFLLGQPDLDFDLGGAANLLDLPGLNGMLKEALGDQIAARLLLPNKVAFRLTDDISAESVYAPRPVGVLAVRVLEAKDLMETDGRFRRIDPYPILRHGSEEKRGTVTKGQNPKWDTADHAFEFPLQLPEAEEVLLLMYDRDTLSQDDFLGSARLSAPVKEGAVEAWLTLEGAESGQVLVRLDWLPTTKRLQDYRDTAGGNQSRAVLTVCIDSCVIEATEEDCFAVTVSINGSVGKTTKVVYGKDPVFREGFTLLVGDVDCEVNIKLEDAGKDTVVGEHSFFVERMLGQNDMSLVLKSHPLLGSTCSSSVAYSARLKFLMGAKKVGKEGSYMLRKASNMASKTGSAVKYLGTTSTGIMRSISPMRKGEEVMPPKPLETDLDEEVFKGPKRTLRSGWSEMMGGSSPDIKEQASEGILRARRRMSEAVSSKK